MDLSEIEKNTNKREGMVNYIRGEIGNLYRETVIIDSKQENELYKLMTSNNERRR